MPTRSLAVGHRIAGISVFFVLALCGILFYTLATLEGRASDAVAVNLAGRQPMLNQRHLKEILQSSRGLDADMAATRAELRQTAEVLRGGGSVTLGSQQVDVPPAPTRELGDALDEQIEALATFERAADDYLARARTAEPEALEAQQLALEGQNAGLHEIANTVVSLFQRHGEDELARMKATEVWVIVLVSLIGGLLSWRVTRSVVVPLTRAARVMQGLEQGDLTVRLENRSNDELGKMARSLNRALDRISETIRAIHDASQLLSNASEDMSRVSQAMGESAESCAHLADDTSVASVEIDANVQTVASATEQMSASIKEISQNAAKASMVADTASTAVEQTTRSVSRLGDSSQEIGNVIKLITAIAEQTNLLALNATIEAARAGEAGKGFAVVATEVKELAKETAKATEDIGRRIGVIQADTSDAVEAINLIPHIIGEINDIQTMIASAVEEQSATTNEIGRSVSQAARGTTEITHHIHGVAESARSTSQSAVGAREAALQLSDLAGRLSSLVERFRLDGLGSAPSASRSA